MSGGPVYDHETRPRYSNSTLSAFPGFQVPVHAGRGEDGESIMVELKAISPLYGVVCSGVDIANLN